MKANEPRVDLIFLQSIMISAFGDIAADAAGDCGYLDSCMLNAFWGLPFKGSYLLAIRLEA